MACASFPASHPTPPSPSVVYACFCHVTMMITRYHNCQQCYVVATGKSGCFVRLQGGVNGRVMLKHLSDRFVSNPRLEFPTGKLVAGKVLSKVCCQSRVSSLSSQRYVMLMRVLAYCTCPSLSHECGRHVFRHTRRDWKACSCNFELDSWLPG